MSACITINFSSPQTLQTACTDSSRNPNVLLTYLILQITTVPHSQHMLQQKCSKRLTSKWRRPCITLDLNILQKKETKNKNLSQPQHHSFFSFFFFFFVKCGRMMRQKNRKKRKNAHKQMRLSTEASQTVSCMSDRGDAACQEGE